MINRERLAWAMFTVTMAIIAAVLLFWPMSPEMCWMPEDLGR